jgi:hypothetical protein
MAELLLEAQVNVAQADGAGKTALHFAAKRVCSPCPASHNPIFPDFVHFRTLSAGWSFCALVVHR